MAAGHQLSSAVPRGWADGDAEAKGVGRVRVGEKDGKGEEGDEDARHDGQQAEEGHARAMHCEPNSEPSSYRFFSSVLRR